MDLPLPGEDHAERFCTFDSYDTNLPAADGVVRVRVEVLIEPETDTYWATILAAGVSAAGSTPAEAAVAAMRAATALL